MEVIWLLLPIDSANIISDLLDILNCNITYYNLYIIVIIIYIYIVNVPFTLWQHNVVIVIVSDVIMYYLFLGWVNKVNDISIST